MDRTSKILTIIVSVVAISLVGSVSTVDGSIYSTIAEAINALAQGQGELINQNSVNLSQNDRLIEQNDLIIELLMNDRNIFLKGESSRYMYVDYYGKGSCLVYDKLLDDTSRDSCFFTTKNQFNEYLYHQETPIRE